MTNILKSTLSNPQHTVWLLGAFSAAALATALTSQYVFGLAPCELCHFQRAPYYAVVAMAILSVFVKYPRVWLSLSALAFFANAGIAFYHTGVERKWWPSFLEGCSTPSLEGNIADVLARIQAAPLVRCDEIPWTDPVIGWSMANYNVIACLILGTLAIFSLIKSCK